MFGFKFGPVLKQYAIVTIANFNYFHIALSVAWQSPAMVILRDPDQTVLTEPLTEEQMSWIVAISSLVDLVAFSFCGYLADNLGRKYSILLACVPRIITCILLFLSTTAWMLLLARGICGLSDAFVVTITASFVSEIASKEIRGGLGSCAQIWSSIGSMVCLSIGPFLSYNMLNTLITTLIVVTSLPLILLPESPYFLYSKGRIDEAINLLTSLRGSEALALEEIEEYEKSNPKINKRELIKDKEALKTFGKVMLLTMFAQLTGNTYLTYHLQTIFELTHTSVSSAISSLILGFVTLLAGCCTIYLSDRFGRKPVILTTLIGQAVGMIGLGVFFKLTEETTDITGFLNYLPLVSMILGSFCYSAGLGALMWILCAELFDGPCRAFGVSLALFAACLFGFLTLRYLTAVMHAIGIAPTYWMFAGVCVITCVFVKFFIPETKGKSFSEIQSDLKGVRQ